MRQVNSLNHTQWECKYHIVFIPKYRRKALFCHIRTEMGKVFRTLAEQRESRIKEGHIMVDHVHMMIPIPPKYSAAQVVGYIKGKSAIHIARTYVGRIKQNYPGQHFWAIGYGAWSMGNITDEMVQEYLEHHRDPSNSDTGNMILE